MQPDVTFDKKMPKPISTLQNQISGCERSIQEALSQCVEIVGNNNFQFKFSLKDFIEGLTTFNIEEAMDGVTKVSSLLEECRKILIVENNRRLYAKEMRKILKARERRETIKRLTIENNFKKKAEPMRIPSPPNGQEE